MCGVFKVVCVKEGWGVVCSGLCVKGGWGVEHREARNTGVFPLSKGSTPHPLVCGVVAAVSYSPTPCRVQYHRRCWA